MKRARIATPRSDLYRFINGEWLETCVIPDDESSWGTLDEVRRRTEQATLTLIETSDEASRDVIEAKIATLYKSYMDTDEVERRGLMPLASDLALVDAVSSVAELSAAQGALKSRGVKSCLDVETHLDPRAPTEYRLFIGQSGLGMPGREFYLDERYAELRADYVSHVERMLDLAGRPDARAEASRVVDLEMALAERHVDRVSRRSIEAIYNVFGPSDLTGLSKLDLSRILQDSFGFDEKLIQEIVITDPEYFSSLDELLVESRLGDWKAWMRWQVVSSRADFLSSEFVDEDFRFFGTVMSGATSLPPRRHRGVALVNAVLGEAVGSLYAKRYFSPSMRCASQEIAREIVAAFRSILLRSKWMGASTREEALRKLDSCVLKIGFPDNVDDCEALAMDESDLVGNVVSTIGYRLRMMAERLKNGADRYAWDSPAHSVNAYYHPMRNEILVPCGILQEPFFSMTATRARNFGAIGAVIGHELAHGFDDVGSTCDADGRYRDWWGPGDGQRFSALVDEVVEQFDGLVPSEMARAGVAGAVRGRLVAGECLADVSGVTAAYNAWVAARSREGIQGGNSDGASAFFEAWARVWRQAWRLESLRLHVETNVHPPAEFRVNQILKNVDAFHECFGTKATDAMWLEPERRIRL